MSQASITGAAVPPFCSQPADERRPAAVGMFRRNVLSNAAGNLAYTGMQLALLWLLFRMMDAQSYAAWLTISALVGVFEMASDYGSRLWATREFSISSMPSGVLVRSVWCKTFYTTVSAGILLILPSDTLTGGEFLLSILVASTQPGTDPILWYLRSRERLDIEAAVVLVCRISTVLLTAAAVWAGGSPLVLLVIWLGCNLIRMAYEAGLVIVKPLFAGMSFRELFRFTDTLQTLAAVFPVGTAFFLTSLFQRIGVLLVDTYSTAEDVRIYGTSFRLVATSGFLATGLFVASFAPLVRAIAADDHSAAGRLIRRELTLVTAIFLPLCLFGLFLAKPVAELLFAPNAEGIAETMVLLMPGLYVSCVNMGLKYAVNAFSLNWPDVVAVLIGIVAVCGVTIFHGNLSWPAAAAVAWGTGEGVILLLRLMLLRSHHRNSGVPLGLICVSAAVLVIMTNVVI